MRKIKRIVLWLSAISVVLIAGLAWLLWGGISNPANRKTIGDITPPMGFQRVEVDMNVLSYIANNVSSNIRELEGALTRVVAFSKLGPSGRPIDIDLAQEALKDYLTSTVVSLITIPRITDIVCERYNIRTDDIQ